MKKTMDKFDYLFSVLDKAEQGPVVDENVWDKQYIQKTIQDLVDFVVGPAPDEVGARRQQHVRPGRGHQLRDDGSGEILLHEDVAPGVQESDPPEARREQRDHCEVGVVLEMVRDPGESERVHV